MKLLMIQPLNLDGSDRGDSVVAVDAVDAGPGDRVLLVTEGFQRHDQRWQAAIADRYGGDRLHR